MQVDMASHRYNKSMPEPEKPAVSFEAALQELESVVKQLEAGDLPLERALELFEKGMELSDSCRKQLEEAETRVEVLTRRGREIQAEPFKLPKA
jgi:exodeoxyribonuclease VII small subunit